MNENLTPNEIPVTPTSTIASTPEKPNNSHKYLALILVLTGICLAAVMYFVYKNSVDTGNGIPAPIVENENKVETTPQSTETSGSVEQDEKMQTDEVTDGILKEIEDVENTNASTSFDESQINDLQ